jgi:hypothetical protein
MTTIDHRNSMMTRTAALAVTLVVAAVSACGRKHDP